MSNSILSEKISIPQNYQEIYSGISMKSRDIQRETEYKKFLDSPYGLLNYSLNSSQEGINNSGVLTPKGSDLCDHPFIDLVYDAIENGFIEYNEGVLTGLKKYVKFLLSKESFSQKNPVALAMMRKGNFVNKNNESLETRIKKSVLQSVKSSNELKWVNITAIAQSTTGTTSISDLTPISSGTASNQRVGDTIKPVRMRLSGNIICGDATQVFRITVFYWLMDNSVDVPSGAELYQDTGSAARTVLSPFIPNKPSKFAVVYDKIFNLDTLAHPQITFTVEIPLRRKVEFNQAAALGRNHVYLAYVSDSAVTPHPTLSYDSMLYFYDD